uniref:Major facilitator superfamily (MFS) profile domain-containing protein n=1 Tax=Meloidogyne javanica TaxID=6303 RepID=A0A915MQF2_MELJA
MHSLLSGWAPPMERGILTGLSYAGAQVGNMLVMPLSGLLCRHGFDGGWPSIFYLFGAIGLFWCLIWFLIGADSPQKHKTIKENEREYILESLGKNKENNFPIEIKRRPIPFYSILTSKPVWAIFVGHFAGDWGLVGLLSPIIMGWLTPNGSKEEWLLVFYVTAFILVVGALIFSFFASAEVQEWAKEDFNYSSNDAENGCLTPNLSVSPNSSEMAFVEDGVLVDPHYRFLQVFNTEREFRAALEQHIYWGRVSGPRRVEYYACRFRVDGLFTCPCRLRATHAHNRVLVDYLHPFANHTHV